MGLRPEVVNPDLQHVGDADSFDTGSSRRGIDLGRLPSPRSPKHERGSTPDAQPPRPTEDLYGLPSRPALRGNAMRKGMPVESLQQAIGLALKDEGHVIELLMCHRSDPEHGTAQSTPDKVLRLRASDGKVAVSQAGEEDLILDASAQHEVQGLEALNLTKDYLLFARMLTPEPSRRLPGPGSKSRLTPDEQKLIGVARWPGMKIYRERSRANQAYGMDFFLATRKTGQLLADGKLRSFRELWHHASEWRMARAASGSRESFKPQPPRQPGETSFTELSDHYEYFMERLEQQEGTLAHVEILLAGDSPYREKEEQLPKIRSTRYQQIGQIGNEKIPLTRVDCGQAMEEDRPLLEQIHDSGALFLTHCLVHTDPRYIPKIIDHVESVFTRVTRGERSPQENLTDLAEIHWWLTNAMPDRRGSAAKAEFCIRSLAYANGIELPPFRRGVLPDMEAFDPSLSCTDYIEKYKTEFFERPPIMPDSDDSTQGDPRDLPQPPAPRRGP